MSRVDVREPGDARRRAWLRAASLGPLVVALPAAAHVQRGRIDPPRPAPNLRLLTADGRTVSLPSQLRGRTTAVQLMFTGCSATCPIQGAIFSAAQAQLRDRPDRWQLLSLSIDPLGDTPKSLREWLGRFDADPALWIAAAPLPRELDTMLDSMAGRSIGEDRHTTQILVFNRRAELIYRTEDLPPGAHVASLVRTVDALP